MPLWFTLSLAGVLGWAGGLRALGPLDADAGMSWRLGALCALAAGCVAPAAARLGLAWSSRRAAFLAAVLTAPGILGFLTPLAARVHLPPPRDLPQYAAEIWLALAWVSGVLACAAMVVLGLWLDRDVERRPRWTALRLFGLCWVAYLGLALWTAGWTCTGDTPRYLMLTRGLAERGSQDLKPEYRERSWLLFHDRDDLEKIDLSNDSPLYSIHRPGLPLMLAPGWLLLGPWGARWVHTGLAAAGAALLFWTALGLGLAPGQALGGFALFAFSAPWLLHSPGAMPDLLCGLLWLVVLAAWARRLPAPAAFLAAGALPWVHVRFAMPALLLLLQNAWLLPKRRLPWLAVGAALVAGSFLLLHAQFGVWSPLALYRQQGLLTDDLALSHLPRGLAGLWLDQEYGWMVWAPAYGLAGAGALRLWRRDRGRALSWLPCLALYIVPVGLLTWWHGYMAPARFLVPAAPLLALLCAETLDLGHSAGQRLLLAWTLVLGWLMAVLPWLCYPKMQGRNLLLDIAGKRLGLDLGAFFPSFVAPNTADLFWAPLAALLLLWSLRRWGRAPAA